MLTYNLQYDKIETRVQDPIAKKWSWIQVPPYTGAQYDLLREDLQDALGEDFQDFEVVDYTAWTIVILSYNGVFVDDIEMPRNDEIDPVCQNWYFEQLEP